MPEKPRLSFWQLWNMSFGFFGIQFGWGLQMANMSAIYRYLGAEEKDIAILWLAAPLTGLLVQPVIGYYSDRTWNRFGRRRPYFMVGAILASIALLLMPHSSTVWMAAGLLWVLDASVNVSMEPFRAFVGDLLPPPQRKTGFAMQSLLIGLGAVLSSALPWLLKNVFGVTGAGSGGAIPLTVTIAFTAGAFVFFLAVLHTILTTREYPPDDPAEFERMKRATAGLGHAFGEIFQGIGSMPKTMRQLAVVQFFTWFALFCMWIYFVPAVAAHHFGGAPGDDSYQRGVEFGGLCFSVYNGVAFGFSFVLLGLVRRFSAKAVHTVCLAIGSAGLITVPFVPSPPLLFVSMTAVGIAWASILSMPYAMLSNALPPARMGFYMGVFNFFIVLPQILASVGLGKVVEKLLCGDAMHAVLMGGAAMLLAAGCVLIVRDSEAGDRHRAGCGP
jgi:maltose/moltooligosaccharide transporter